MGLFSKRNEVMPQHLAVLRKIPLFSTLRTKELMQVERILHERSYLADEIVFEEGDEGLGMYIVVEGEVRIQRKVAGVSRPVAQLGPGSYFGELALLEGFPRAASVQAASNARLLGFFRPEFLKILETQGRTGAKLSLQLAKHTCVRMREALANSVLPLISS